ncbi:MAG: S16 family serine protease [Egibacteraceae bacterium]
MARTLRWAFLPLSMVILSTAVLIVPMPFFVEKPGGLLSLGGCVSVEAPSAEQVAGDYLLTTINLRQASLAGMIAAWPDKAADVVPADAILGQDEDAPAFFARQRRVFGQSAQRAAALGLEAAGIEVDQEALTGEGALVVGVRPGSAADGVLEGGDVILGVDGGAVTTAEELISAITDTSTVTVRFARNDREREVELTPRLEVIGGEERPIIGAQIQTFNERIELPIPVDVTSGRIGGPSAGLMIALTVFDKVDAVDLAAGRRVAGTGTIGLDGRVGPIGGISLKALAAEREGADVFLAPRRQAEAARSGLAADSGLEVLAVDTLDEAVAALRRSAASTPGAAQENGPPPCPVGTPA